MEMKAKEARCILQRRGACSELADSVQSSGGRRHAVELAHFFLGCMHDYPVLDDKHSASAPHAHAPALEVEQDVEGSSALLVAVAQHAQAAVSEQLVAPCVHDEVVVGGDTPYLHTRLLSGCDAETARHDGGQQYLVDTRSSELLAPLPNDYDYLWKERNGIRKP